MDQLKRDFAARSREVRKYVEMLRYVDLGHVQLIPKLKNAKSEFRITRELFGVMKANVFLLLYNVVESTITSCLRSVGESIRDQGFTFKKLNEKWRKAWLQELGKTSDNIGPEKRLEAALIVCECLTRELVIDFSPSLNSGNLDDRRIEEMANRYGVVLKIRPKVRTEIKRQVLDDLGLLGLVRKKRNTLAHGLELFSECGKMHAVADLQGFTKNSLAYLQDVIDSFESYIDSAGFSDLVDVPANAPPNRPSQRHRN